MKKAKTVDTYLKDVPPKQRAALQKLRKIIKAAQPGLEEKIAYGMPGYYFKGRPLVYFAAFKNHLSFFPGARITKEILGAASKKYEISGVSTIKFQPEKPLPAPLVKKIIKARIKHNESRRSYR